MSDSPAIGFAIGSLAASRGASELAELSASIMTPRPVWSAGSGADIRALVQTIQEQEQHIARQDDFIARLRQVGLEWEDYGKKLKAKHTKLEEWAEWAEQELKKREAKA